MYTLFYAPGTASLAVHWLLIEIGAPHELREVDIEAGAQKSAAYLALNPSGHVPTMMVDGRPHAECAALLMLLAERHPEAGLEALRNSAERPDYLQWMVFLANTLQPAFRAWFYASEPAGPPNAAAVQAHAQLRIEAAFDRLDGVFADGRHYLLGQQLSAPDFLATMLFRWSRNMPRPADAWPHLRAYSDQMRALPSLKEVHRREKLTDWISAPRQT